MNVRRTANSHELQGAPRVVSTVVTRDPKTGEFHYEERLVADMDYVSPIEQPVVDDVLPNETSDDNPVALPERASKRRLRRQSLGHSALIAVAACGIYVAGDYAVTFVKSGETPNIAEDIVQLPADIGSTYDEMKSALNAMQSWGEAAENINQYLPENGDK